MCRAWSSCTPLGHEGLGVALRAWPPLLRAAADVDDAVVLWHRSWTSHSCRPATSRCCRTYNRLLHGVSSQMGHIGHTALQANPDPGLLCPGRVAESEQTMRALFKCVALYASDPGGGRLPENGSGQTRGQVSEGMGWNC